jgi:CheY-like chemotaxis protein
VLEAENGPEALSIIENVPDIAILLSDVVMPGGIDGRELARRARRQRPEMRIVLMSGYAYGNSDDDGGTAAEPALPMLGKPFEKRQLAAILQTSET